MPKGSSKIYSYSKEELQDLLDYSQSYSDILRKIGLNPKGGNPETLKRVIKEYDLDTTKLNENRNKIYSDLMFDLSFKRKRNLSDLLQKGVVYSPYKLLHRLYKEGLKEPKCERCMITTWEGEQISFHLHHKDGDRLNNELDNLQVLCPNCHSLTENFAGKATKKNRGNKKKNRNFSKCLRCGKDIGYKYKYCEECIKDKRSEKSKINSITREDLKDLIRTTPFTTIAKQFDVSDNAIRKWCKKYDLPYQTSVIKGFTNEEWEKI